MHCRILRLVIQPKVFPYDGLGNLLRKRAAAFAAKAAEAAARAEAEEEVQNMEDAAAEATTEEAPGVELTEAEVEAAE